jgi:hypothetical protein
MSAKKKTPWIESCIRYFDGLSWCRIQIAMVISQIFGKGDKSVSQYKSKVTKVLGTSRQQEKWGVKRKATDISPASSQNMDVDEETYVPVERPVKKARFGREEYTAEL